MRKPHVGLAWLHRFWLWLMLAGLACCPTSQLGPGQAPVIVNRAMAVLAPPLPIFVNRTPAIPYLLGFEATTAPLPPLSSSPDFVPIKWVPPLSSVPVFAGPLAMISDDPLAAPSQRPAFGSVIGLEGSNGIIDHRTTFFRLMKAGFAEPFVLRESSVQIKDSNPRTVSFSDPIPQSISLRQPFFRRE